MVTPPPPVALRACVMEPFASTTTLTTDDRPSELEDETCRGPRHADLTHGTRRGPIYCHSMPFMFHSSFVRIDHIGLTDLAARNVAAIMLAVLSHLFRGKNALKFAFQHQLGRSTC